MPGAVALPGGHVETGEQPEEALRRELEEELGIAPLEVRYVCTLLHRSEEFRKLHYFAVTHWEGHIRNREAASLRWLPLTGLQELDLDVDRLAVTEYLRVYGVISSDASGGADFVGDGTYRLRDGTPSPVGLEGAPRES